MQQRPLRERSYVLTALLHTVGVWVRGAGAACAASVVVLLIVKYCCTWCMRVSGCVSGYSFLFFTTGGVDVSLWPFAFLRFVHFFCQYTGLAEENFAPIAAAEHH